ncbi:hypothetical protein [Chitinophaga jiangningensis]|nr:hypothetical protein [Chitinophaga jiangningensis]
MENLRLVNHGKFAMGNVTDQWRGKSPATVYLFDVNGHFYSGSVKIVAGYAIGDSIVVVYDPGDPDLNRPYRYLQENFDMPLHSDSTLPR